MKDPRVEIRPDHLLLRLDGAASALAPRREVVVPFSDIVDATTEAPRWPSLAGQWQIAAYVPGVIAVGDFHEWNGKRRLLALDRHTKRSLTLRLEGHPAYDEITIQSEDAEALASRLAGERKSPWNVAPRE